MVNLKSNKRSLLLLVVCLLVACGPALPAVWSSATPSAATVTPLPSATPSATSGPLVHYELEERCFQVAEEPLPADVRGTLWIELRREDRVYEEAVLDLDTDAITRNEDWHIFSISPRSTRVSYYGPNFESMVVADTGFRTIWQLHQLEDAEGSLHFADWVGDTHIILAKIGEAPKGSRFFPLLGYVLIDLENGARREFQTDDYPGHLLLAAPHTWWTPELVINPNLDVLIYPNYGGLILWDIEQGGALADVYGGQVASPPSWAPSGEYAVVSTYMSAEGNTNVDDGLPNRGWDLLLISNTGAIERLTYFGAEVGAWQRYYQWSPDGEYISFLQNPVSYDGNYRGDLMLVEVGTGPILNRN